MSHPVNLLGYLEKISNTGIEADLTNNELIEENDYEQDPSYYSYNKSFFAYLRRPKYNLIFHKNKAWHSYCYSCLQP
jgi:hypothetical protein